VEIDSSVLINKMARKTGIFVLDKEPLCHPYRSSQRAKYEGAAEKEL
jgi:hypothetical protein